MVLFVACADDGREIVGDALVKSRGQLLPDEAHRNNRKKKFLLFSQANRAAKF